MKLALGLFHFNPHWNVDRRSGHRHCTETLAPLLACLATNADWRLSLEVSGSGLEFIQGAYPQLIQAIRRLIDRGQVELISSLYTPNLWVAFPRRDLLQSIRLNQACLDRLRLPRSRIFFAQEAFFGEGVATLGEYFDVAVCKDDYLSHFYAVELTHTLYTMRGMKIVVASNHLLNDLNAWMGEDPSLTDRYALTPEHRKHLATISGLNRAGSFPGKAGKVGETEWIWYHCGDGNHFGTIHKPDNLDLCYYDSTWNTLCMGLLHRYCEKGYDFATIETYAKALDYSVAQELPILVEGAWNPSLSNGVRRWMGENTTKYEDDCGVLTTVSRARCRLRDAETAVSRAKEPTPEALTKSLHEAWNWLLHAQISDSLGWSAGPLAAQQAILLAEQAFITANQILFESGELSSPLPLKSPTMALPENHVVTGEREMIQAVLFGADGTVELLCNSENEYRLECCFEPNADAYGIRFPFEMGELVYCPSGMETTPCRVPFAGLLPEVITLPLANGLLRLSQHWFLVKDTQTVHVAARICPLGRKVEFSVSGHAPRRPHHWRFYLLRTSLRAATMFANSINRCGTSTEAE